jgi:voltage-dependent potassium channel beta subunit
MTMEYRRLGKSGLKLSEISFGSWFTFGSNLDLDAARQLMKMAFDYGINFFDNAEVYANGASELIMGEVLRDFKREDLVVSTKIFWGGKGANAVGLSRKHLMEGTRNSLRRLQLSYVDLIYCHRPDTDTPIEETVRAMDAIIRSGAALYWGTSEWKRSQIEEAHQIAKQIGAIPPTMEQPEYNLFHRDRVEKEYASLYSEYGMGVTTWSPLSSGILTGKYNEGIPEKTRLAMHPEMRVLLTPEKIEKVKALALIARDLGCTLAQLAIAWCLKNTSVSTVLVGASNFQQLQDNLKATEVKRLLVPEVMKKIEATV